MQSVTGKACKRLKEQTETELSKRKRGVPPPKKREIEAYVENINGINHGRDILGLSQVLPGDRTTGYNLRIIKVRGRIAQVAIE